MAEGLQVAGLLDLQLVGLGQTLQLLILLLYYLFVLELDQLPLLLKVLHDLAETRLQKINLCFQLFYLGVLAVLLECYLLVHLEFLLQLCLQVLVQLREALCLLLHVLKLILLQRRLIVESLILLLNVLLNL